MPVACGGSGSTTSRSASFVDADFGLLTAAVRNGEIQPRLLSDKQRRARTGGCRDVRDTRKAAGVLFLKDVDEPFAAADVQTLARRIEEQIIRVTDNVERRGFLARRRVVHQHLCRP